MSKRESGEYIIINPTICEPSTDPAYKEKKPGDYTPGQIIKPILLKKPFPKVKLR